VLVSPLGVLCWLWLLPLPMPMLPPSDDDGCCGSGYLIENGRDLRPELKLLLAEAEAEGLV
jgi:hypothetical protein